MAETVKKAKAPAKPRAAKSANKEKETATETATPKATTAKAASKKTSEKAAPRVPTHDEIAKLAHKYWAERGHHHGHAEQDWLRAERELTQNAE